MQEASYISDVMLDAIGRTDSYKLPRVGNGSDSRSEMEGPLFELSISQPGVILVAIFLLVEGTPSETRSCLEIVKRIPSNSMLG